MNFNLIWYHDYKLKYEYAQKERHYFKIEKALSPYYKLFFKEVWNSTYKEIGEFKDISNAKLFADAYINNFMLNNPFYFYKKEFSTPSIYHITFNNKTCINDLSKEEAISIVHHLNCPNGIWKKVK